MKHFDYHIIRQRFALALLLFMSVATLSVSAQGTATKSEIVNTKISVSFSDTPMKDVITTLQRRSKIFISFNEKEMAQVPAVSQSFSNATVPDILKKCLAGTRYITEITSNSILIRHNSNAQRIVAYGIIVDKNNVPLPGASVILKGTTHGTSADGMGRYRLDFAKRAQNTLVVSYLGMETRELNIVRSSKMDIVLYEDANEVQEVVVNGFYEQSKNTFTGAATSIKGEELLMISQTNVMAAISKLTPGMVLVENNTQGSNPNAVPSLLIRGANSLVTESSEMGINDPLVVLDGVEISMEELYDLDIFDIERVDVLKDASATIMYGENGANGVIVIERKKIEDAKVRLNYNFVPKFSIPDLTSIKLTDASQKLELERLAGLYDDPDGSMAEAYAYKLENVRRGVNTDWIHAPLRVPFSHNHSLTLSSRGENLEYRANINVNDGYGVMKGDNRRKYGLGFNLTYHTRNKLTVSYRANYSLTDSKDTPYGNFSDYTMLNPYEPIYDEYGDYITNYYFDPFNTSSSKMANPLYNATLSSFSTSRNQSLTNALDAKWYITKLFFITGQANIGLTTGQNDRYVSPDDVSFLNITDQSQRGSYTYAARNGFNYSGRVVATYARELDKKGSMFRLSAGSNVKRSTSTSTTSMAQGFLKDELNDLAFAMGYKTNGSPSGFENISAEVGVFANANISFRNRYFADASYRASGSSRFGSDNSWAPFWSLGIGWNLHNESFIKDIDWIGSLTLRYSVGYNGSITFPYYQAKTVYDYKYDYNYYTGIGATPLAMGNSALKWQKKLNNNVGLSATLLDDRISFSADYYNNTTFDLLMPITLPPSVGVKSVNVNFGELNNSGYEFTLSGQIIKNQDWLWSMTVSGGHVMDKINEISDVLKDTEYSDGTDKIQPTILFEEGGSQFDIYAVRSAGIDPASGREIFINKDGDHVYKYNSNDRVVVGNTNPILSGSVSTYLRYKAWTLSVATSYTFGGDYYNSTLWDKVENIDPYKNVDERAFTQRWKNKGDLVRFLAIRESAADRDMFYSERFVERRNEIYLSNVSVSYEFASKALKRLGMQRLNLGFGMSDIGYLSTVKFERGTSYPYCRSFNLTLRPTF